MYRLSASNANRFFNCSASEVLAVPTLYETTKYKNAAEFGTLCHEICEYGYLNKLSPVKAINANGVTSKHKRYADIKHIVTTYLQYVRKNFDSGITEQKVVVPYLDMELVYIADFYRYYGNVFHFVDLKSGTRDYMDSAIDQLRFSFFADVIRWCESKQWEDTKELTFKGTIVQPLYWQEGHRTPTVTEVWTVGEVKQELAILNDSMRDIIFFAGSHCKFCKRLPWCPKIKHIIGVTALMAEEDIACSFEQMEDLYRIKAIVKDYFEAQEQMLLGSPEKLQQYQVVEKTYFGKKKQVLVPKVEQENPFEEVV